MVTNSVSIVDNVVRITVHDDKEKEKVVAKKEGFFEGMRGSRKESVKLANNTQVAPQSKPRSAEISRAKSVTKTNQANHATIIDNSTTIVDNRVNVNIYIEEHERSLAGRVMEFVKENPVKTAVAVGAVASGTAWVYAPTIAGFIGSTGILGTTAGGTVISTLQGVALQNASLAVLGGGAKTAGGFGIVGGKAVIAGTGGVAGAGAVGVSIPDDK